MFLCACLEIITLEHTTEEEEAETLEEITEIKEAVSFTLIFECFWQCF